MDAKHRLFKSVHETSQVNTVLIECVVVADVYSFTNEEGFSLSHNPIMKGIVFRYYDFY